MIMTLYESLFILLIEHTYTEKKILESNLYLWHKEYYGTTIIDKEPGSSS